MCKDHGLIFVFVFACVISKTPKTLNLSTTADDTITLRSNSIFDRRYSPSSEIHESWYRTLHTNWPNCLHYFLLSEKVWNYKIGTMFCVAYRTLLVMFCVLNFYFVDFNGMFTSSPTWRLKMHVLCKVGKNIIFQNKTLLVMLYRHNKTFWYQFCNFKHFLKAENSLASLCEDFCINFHVTQYETGLLLELHYTGWYTRSGISHVYLWVPHKVLAQCASVSFFNLWCMDPKHE